MGLFVPCFLAFLLFDFLRRLPALDDNRKTLCLTALALGLFVALSTEILSAFHFLTPAGAWLTWSTACLTMLALRFSRLKLTSPPLRISLPSVITDADWLSFGMAGTIFVFVAVTGLVAWAAVPNNYDSMTYHLARVIHWRQDHSIAFFPTSDYRENASPPLAEWIILHLTLLQGDARAANLLQWASYLGCIAGVSLLTEKIGGAPRTGLLAAFFTATLPAAVLEATSTQNDLVMAFWLVCLAYGCLLVRDRGWLGVFIVGAAAGLGVLTKTVVLLYCFPFLVAALLLLVSRGLRFLIPRAALIGLLVLVPSLGHFARNEVISGSVLGPGPDARSSFHPEANAAHTPGLVFSNVIRNLGLHAVVLGHAAFAEELIDHLHEFFGLNPNEPRATYLSSQFHLRDLGEEGCPMPFHVAAALVAIGMSLIGLRRELPLAAILSLAVLAGAFLFCLALQWQPFNSRLHLPLLILAAPVVALVFQRRAFRFILPVLLFLFVAPTIPNVFAYPQRPAIGPHSVFIASADEQQYARLPALREPYVRAIQLLIEHHAHEVGFISFGNDWEYPIAAYGNVHQLWRTDHVLLPPHVPLPAEIARTPDALVCNRPGFGDTVDLHGRSFKRIYSHVAHPSDGPPVPVSVYFPTDPPKP